MEAKKPRRPLPSLTIDMEFAGGEVLTCETTDDLKAEAYMKWARAAFQENRLIDARFFVQAAQVHATLALAKHK